MSVTYEVTSYVNHPNGYRIEKLTRTDLSGTSEEREAQPLTKLIGVAYLGTAVARTRVTFDLKSTHVNDDAWEEFAAILPSVQTLWSREVQKHLQETQANHAANELARREMNRSNPDLRKGPVYRDGSMTRGG